MRRWILVGVIVGAVVLSTIAGAPAQAQEGKRKVIQVSMTSFKYTPNLITVNQGDTVVLQFSNDDADRRPHNFSSRLFGLVTVTARGEIARQGPDDDGRRLVAAEAGKKFELEFVASQRGTFPFVCSVFNHAERGMSGAINVMLAQP